MTGLLLAPARSWTLTIPAPTKWAVKPGRAQGTRLGVDDYDLTVHWLTMNRDVHPMAKHRHRDAWQKATKQAALAAVGPGGRVGRLPVGEVSRARIDIRLHFVRWVRRDTNNWQPTGKAIVDALAAGTRRHPHYGFLPDDEPLKHLHCEDCPHLHKSRDLIPGKPPLGPGALVVVTLTEMHEEIL